MNDVPISADERARRQKAIDFARTNIELSGFTLSPGIEALGVRFVAGELSESEYLAAALDHANALPASAPAQDYFTSLEQLEAARPARDRP
ncbi:antitoxin VbhA family protein [Sphingobium sp. B2]|uniref:antitoxin VbhA family protein n=1 Tax=Sphingobium sp. B2 TaxID=2583228 RepID=UPI0011A8E157|nr:antitoxin VbhA family protein [Sphingobium sp. B2]